MLLILASSCSSSGHPKDAGMNEGGERTDTGCDGSAGADTDSDADTDADAAADAAALNDASVAFELTVLNGYGSGIYSAGERVHVWSGARPCQEVVTQWEGDAEVLERPGEWHTALLMPSRDVTLQAVVEERDDVFEEITFTGSTRTGKTIIYSIPRPARGLILMLHGTSGSARMIEGEEARYIALYALAYGYGVLAPEAEEAAAGDLNQDDKIRWDPSLSYQNMDFANLDMLMEYLYGQNIIEAGTPLYVLGMSNGGAMSVSLGAISASSVADDFPNLRFNAAVCFCASGRASSAAISTTPTAWLLCANDDNEQVSNDAAAENSAALVSRGIDTLLDQHPASPLYSERFTRVPGVNRELSLAVAGELRAAGFVDEEGVFLTPTVAIMSQVEEDTDSFPAALSLGPGTLKAVVDQIRVMQAEHQLYSDWTARALDFISSH